MQTPPGLGRPPRCRPPGLDSPPLDADPLHPWAGQIPLDADPPWMQTPSPQGWADPRRCRPTGVGQTPPPGCRSPLDEDPPDTVNKWAVRILLECIIVRNVNNLNFYRPQTKLRKGNVFTPVCVSVHGGGVHPPRQTHAAPGRHIPPPPRGPLQWTVRILLECILVSHKYICL